MVDDAVGSGDIDIVAVDGKAEDRVEAVEEVEEEAGKVEVNVFGLAIAKAGDILVKVLEAAGAGAGAPAADFDAAILNPNVLLPLLAPPLLLLLLLLLFNVKALLVEAVVGRLNFMPVPPPLVVVLLLFPPILKLNDMIH